MLKKLFAAIVSAAMLFCMSTSAMSVHAEDPVSITIEGAENDTIDLYFRKGSDTAEDVKRSFTLDSNDAYDEVEFSVIDGYEVLYVSKSTWSSGEQRGGDIWFYISNEGTAVVQASVGATVLKTFTVNTHAGNYVSGYDNSSNRVLAQVGDKIDVEEYVLSHALPAGGDFSDEEFTYSLPDNYMNNGELNGKILTTTGENTIRVKAVSKTGKEFYFYVEVVSDPVSSFTFGKEQFSVPYKEDGSNTVYLYLTTVPSNAISGINGNEIQLTISDPTIAEVGNMYDGSSSIDVHFKKPGTVEVTAKYKDFTTTTTAKCYVSKTPETIECPDSIKGYKGYMSYFNYSFGSDEEVDRDAVFEVIEGKDVVEVTTDKGSYNQCPFIAKDYGEAVIRVKSAKNENIYKDVKVVVTDEPAPAPTLTIKSNGKEVPVKNDSITVEKDVTLVFQYSYEAMPNEGSSDFLGIENLFNQVETSKILGVVGGGSGGGDISGFGIAFRTVEYGSDTFEVLPGKFLKINVVENVTEEPETPSDKPVVEDTKVEVADTISKEDAAVITETLSKAEVTSVVDAIKPEAKEALIAELTKGIDTEGKEVTLSVVNTVKVTAADLKSENKSITYEISPKAVVTVDGVAINTVDLKNAQLTGNKDIEVTLPINGLDLKEIVHRSEGYDPEYIYDFVISKEGTVTFKISHFSSFTLNEVITKPAEPSKGTVGTVSPNTGDHTEVMLYGGIGIVALIGALAVILFRRKHA